MRLILSHNRDYVLTGQRLVTIKTNNDLQVPMQLTNHLVYCV